MFTSRRRARYREPLPTRGGWSDPRVSVTDCVRSACRAAARPQLTHAIEEKELKAGGVPIMTKDVEKKAAKYVIKHMTENLEVYKRASARSTSKPSSDKKPASGGGGSSSTKHGSGGGSGKASSSHRHHHKSSRSHHHSSSSSHRRASGSAGSGAVATEAPAAPPTDGAAAAAGAAELATAS